MLSIAYRDWRRAGEGLEIAQGVIRPRVRSLNKSARSQRVLCWRESPTGTFGGVMIELRGRRS